MSTKSDIDDGFYQRARSELENRGVTATELLRRHPSQSKTELAKIIGNGVTARGLTMILYQEAHEQTSVRDLARDLLYRKIVQEFPEGWTEDDPVRATVKLGSWHYDVVEFASECEEKATKILQSLATTDRPETGWKPTSSDDEQIRRLFEIHWVRSE